MVMVDPEENKLQLLGYLLQMKLQKGIYSEEELVPLKRGGVSASSSLGKFINLRFSALLISVQMSSSHVLESDSFPTDVFVWHRRYRVGSRGHCIGNLTPSLTFKFSLSFPSTLGDEKPLLNLSGGS